MSWSREEVSAFLAEKPRLARLATASKEGAPHVVPVWFTEEGDRFLVHSMAGRKSGNLQENPRYSLTVDEDAPPYKGVTFHGRGSVDTSMDYAPLIREQAIRFLGEEMGAGYGDFIAGLPGEHVTLVLDIDEWSDWDFSQAG